MPDTISPGLGAVLFFGPLAVVVGVPVLLVLGCGPNLLISTYYLNKRYSQKTQHGGSHHRKGSGYTLQEDIKFWWKFAIPIVGPLYAFVC